MKFLHSWASPVNPDRRDMVFEGRNKEYGGYEIRSKYEKYAFLALVISVLAIGLAFTIPMVLNYLSRVDFGNEVKVTEGITLEEPPPIDKATPPPPPVIPPPPVQQTIKFTPPKVVKDEEVEEPPPTQEEVKETVVSTVTQEG